MFCPKCGKELSSEVAFCGDCGAPVGALGQNTSNAKKVPDSRKRKWWLVATVIAVIAVVALGGAAFALQVVFEKPTLEGKWALTSQVSTPDGTFEFADADLAVRGSEFDLTVRRTGDMGNVLDMMAGDSMTFKGNCTLEGEGDQLVYGLSVADFSTNVEGVSSDQVATFIEPLISQFNTLGAKLKVPVGGLGDNFPQGEWSLEMAMEGMQVSLFADVQSDSAQSGSVGVGVETEGSRMAAQQGSWSKSAADDTSAEFEFTLGTSTAKIVVTRL